MQDTTTARQYWDLTQRGLMTHKCVNEVSHIGCKWLLITIDRSAIGLSPKISVNEIRIQTPICTWKWRQNGGYFFLASIFLNNGVPMNIRTDSKWQRRAKKLLAINIRNGCQYAFVTINGLILVASIHSCQLCTCISASRMKCSARDYPIYTAANWLKSCQMNTASFVCEFSKMMLSGFKNVWINFYD